MKHVIWSLKPASNSKMISVQNIPHGPVYHTGSAVYISLERTNSHVTCPRPAPDSCVRLVQTSHFPVGAPQP